MQNPFFFQIETIPKQHNQLAHIKQTAFLKAIKSWGLVNSDKLLVIFLTFSLLVRVFEVLQ
jgi:hypothetical protein